MELIKGNDTHTHTHSVRHHMKYPPRCTIITKLKRTFEYKKKTDGKLLNALTTVLLIVYFYDAPYHASFP